MGTKHTGQRWGWKGGFLGASCWIPVIAGLLLAKGDTAGGLLCLLCYALCLAALWRFLPWRQPQVLVWKLYLASFAPIVLTTLVLVWRLGQAFELPFWPLGAQLLLMLPVMLLPAWTIGRKSWSQLESPAKGASPSKQ